MFSGIVEECAQVIDRRGAAGATRLVVESGLDQSQTRVGDSVAIEGVCLTVSDRNGDRLIFDVSAESCRRSTLDDLRKGCLVNLERSLKLGDRVHGHLVFGHVDAKVALRSRVKEGQSEKLVWELPPEFKKYLVSKCSIALSGVSLTVGEVGPDTFTTYLIPHTLAVTTLKSLKSGDHANLEVDMLARYVHSLLGCQADRNAEILKLLTENGFLPPSFSH